MLGNTIEDITRGVSEIVLQLRHKMPESKVILLGILPKNHERYGEKPKQLNVLLKKLADGNNVYWLDMWDAFETKEGKQKTELFVADRVHLLEAGYEVWAKTMEPLLNQLLLAHPWVPEPKDGNWMRKHQEFLNQTHIHGKEAQIVFIGDSITAHWLIEGKDVWAKYYATRHAFNYGIGGDRTEHVLWRVENKEFDGIKPKVAVLMIGISLEIFET